VPIPREPFGSTDHQSSRILFGAAALAAMKPERAAGVLALLLEHGINHIDTAASYGASELCLAPWLREHRDAFFLATKTGERQGAAARESLHRSLERMGVDRVDMIQLHNLVDESGWQIALGPGGAREGRGGARGEGRVRGRGVTGHGTHAPPLDRRGRERGPNE
jgi:aryl-alcohol dehydrogenase-like predicted oxidoreductase